MLVRFSHIMVYSLQHAEAVKWYCEKLGYEVDYNAVGEYASLHHKDLGKLAVHATADASMIGKGPMPFFLCEDIHKTIVELRTNGVKVRDPVREGESPWFTNMHDLDGNCWGIEER